MNPQLMKYARETDLSIASLRRENRQKLFTIYPQLSISPKSPLSSLENVEPYKEVFGHRILVRCESIKFKLQVMKEETEPLCQIEPYHTTLCLFDAKNGRKLTENFHFDVNEASVRNMLQNSECANGNGLIQDENRLDLSNRLNNSDRSNNTDRSNNIDRSNNSDRSNHLDVSYNSDLLEKIPQEWIMYPRKSVLNVTCAHADIFLVVRIEKVLQGGICQSTEPYIRATKDIKAASKVHKTIISCCQRLGSYRMPFAWTARPLFR